jgi:hypothetical protein
MNTISTTTNTLFIRLNNSLYESRIRKSIRKSDVGFCWDLTFVTYPTFVSLAIRLFRNGKRKYFFSTFGNESPIRKSNPETKVLLYRRNESRNEVRIRKSQTNKQSREWVPGLSRGHRGAIRFMEDTCLQDLLCTCCMHRGIREGPGRIRRSCLCKHPYSASATECQQRWHKLAPSSDSLQYLKQLSSSRALLAAQDAPRLRIGPGQKSTAAWRGYIDTSVWPKCRYSIRGLR